LKVLEKSFDISVSGAHHLDLMFENELDPPSVRAARQLQLQVPHPPPSSQSISTHIPQHIAAWLSLPPPAAAAPQCQGASAVWPWVVGVLVALQLCSLALFNRHVKAMEQRKVVDEGRVPLLM
jgi:hypothetical protein